MNNLYRKAVKNNETEKFFRGCDEYELFHPDYGLIAAGHIGHIKSYIDENPSRELSVYESLRVYIENADRDEESFRYVLANIKAFLGFKNKGYASFSRFMPNEEDSVFIAFKQYINSLDQPLTQEHVDHACQYLNIFCDQENRFVVSVVEGLINASKNV